MTSVENFTALFNCDIYDVVPRILQTQVTQPDASVAKVTQALRERRYDQKVSVEVGGHQVAGVSVPGVEPLDVHQYLPGVQGEEPGEDDVIARTRLDQGLVLRHGRPLQGQKACRRMVVKRVIKVLLVKCSCLYRNPFPYVERQLEHSGQCW